MHIKNYVLVIFTCFIFNTNIKAQDRSDAFFKIKSDSTITNKAKELQFKTLLNSHYNNKR